MRVQREPSGHLLLSGKRPDIIIEENGAQTFVDVRTCDPLLRDATGSAQAMYEKCVDAPGSAAAKEAQTKDNAWKELVECQGDVFIPLCHEMPGLVGEAAMSLLDQAAARFSPSASQQNAFSMFWLARLHVANARGVAATIMESLPSYAESPFRPRHLTNSVQAFPSPFPSHFEQSALGRRPVGMPVGAFFIVGLHKKWHSKVNEKEVVLGT